LAVPFLRVTEEPHAQCYPSPPTPGFLFLFMGHGHCLQRKEEGRLDAEIKRMQNASFYILAMTTSVMYYEKVAVEANALV